MYLWQGSSRRKEWRQINQIQNKRGEITIDITEIQKNHKRTLCKVICQQIGQPKRTGQTPRNIQPSKTDLGRNRQSEQTDH